MNIKAIEKVLEDSLVSMCNIVLFGVGECSDEFLRQTTIQLPEVIYDNDETKWGRKIFENRFVVAPPRELQKISDKTSVSVLIMSGHDSEIACQIEEYGFQSWISLPYLIHRITIEDKIEDINIKSCMIEASNFCNARCSFCINPTMKRKKMNMSSEIFEQVVFRLKELNQNPEKFWLHCLGEPLMDPNLFQKVRRLKSDFPNSSVGYASNLSIATSEIIKEIFESGQDFLVISLNTSDKYEYQSVMGLDYDKTIENIHKLLLEKWKRSSNLIITMSIVENENNLQQVREFTEKWEKEGIEVRTLKEGKWVQKRIEKDSRVYQNIRYDHHVLKRYVCQQLYEEICILSNGMYALCCFDGEGCMKLGNVTTTSIYDMFHIKSKNKLMRAIMHGEDDLDICRSCSFLK